MERGWYTLLLVAWLVPRVAVGGEPALLDTHEAAQPSWQIARTGHARIVEQTRTRVEREGKPNGVERLRYVCRPGYAARLWRPVGKANVLDELRVSLAMKCDLPGGVLAARVVLPRSIDPGTGKPATATLRGERYETPGEWRTLTIAETPQLTAAAARLLRARPGSPPIDERGAYVDRVALLLPGAQAATTVWIDDLQVDGVVRQDNTTTASTRSAGPVLPELRSEPPPPSERVTLTASGFKIGGRDFFPRVWSHRGGTLSAAREAGFNTVAFDEPPTPGQLAEAAKQKLRVICTPPGNPGPGAALDEDAWAPVIAWRVGGRDGSIDAARAFAERLRRTDLVLRRPLVAEVDSDWAAWSRFADALIVSRSGPKSAAADRLWSERVQDVRRLARPGTPLLQRIETTLGDEAAGQLAALAGISPDDSDESDTRIAASVWSAIAHQTTGVWIAAGGPLSGADASAARRRRGLKLLNLQLDLVDPWLAGGERGTVLTDGQGEPRAVQLKRGRVRLVAPLRPVTDTAPPSEVVVPGVSSSSQAYRLTPAGVSPTRAERVAGGARLGGDTLSPWSMALLTDDRMAINAIARRAAKTAEEAAGLQLQLARSELSAFVDRNEHNRQAAPSQLRRRATRRISVASAASAAGNASSAFASASLARLALAAPTASEKLSANALTRSPLDTIGGDRRVAEQLAVLLAGAPRGANLLAGGDFEELDQTRQSGWVNTTLPLDGVGAAVELSAKNPAHGARGLRMATTLENGAAMPLAAGDCPVWITTPPTPLSAGQLIEVTGWVRLEPAGGAHPPRLVISDTLGGAELGRVVDSASQWTPFRLLRRAPRASELRVTFGLSGVGEGFVDAVMIRPVQIGATPTPPATLRPAAPVAVRPGGDQAK